VDGTSQRCVYKRLQGMYGGGQECPTGQNYGDGREHQVGLTRVKTSTSEVGKAASRGAHSKYGDQGSHATPGQSGVQSVPVVSRRMTRSAARSEQRGSGSSLAHGQERRQCARDSQSRGGRRPRFRAGPVHAKEGGCRPVTLRFFTKLSVSYLNVSFFKIKNIFRVKIKSFKKTKITLIQIIQRCQ
jgi:hypothetical protein